LRDADAKWTSELVVAFATAVAACHAKTLFGVLLPKHHSIIFSVCNADAEEVAVLALRDADAKWTSEMVVYFVVVFASALYKLGR